MQGHLRTVISSSMLTACLVAAVVFCAARAGAQETYGLLAGPIASGEFNHAMTRLDLRWDQRLAAEAAHERYKTRWQALRDNEILGFTSAMREMQQSGMAMPSMDQIKDILDRRKTIRKRIIDIERALFDSLGEIVADERQRTMLERTRLLRERQRYEASLMAGMVDSNHADLVLIIEDELDLSPEVHAALDETLQRYERSVTGALRSLDEETNRMFEDILDLLEEMGYEDMEDDPQRAQQAMMQLGAAMQEAAADARKAAEQIESIDTRYADQLRFLMPDRTAKKFHRRFLAEVYPEVYSDGSTPETLIERAVELDDLSAGERSRIADIEASWQIRYDAICDDMLDEHKTFTEQMQQAQMGLDVHVDWQAHSERMQEMTQEREEINLRAREEVSRVLGEERAMRAEARSAAHAHGEIVALSAAVGAQGHMIVDAVSLLSAASRHDAAVPGKITSNELHFYVDRLGLSDDMRGLVSEFHDSYQARYDALIEAEYETLIGEPGTRIWDETGGNTDAAEEVAAGRRMLAMKVLDLEDTFFDEMEMLLPAGAAESMQAVRTARACAAYDIGALSGTGRAPVDFVSILRSIDLSRDELAAIEPILRDFDARRLPLLRALRSAFIEQQVAQVRGQNLWRDAQQTGGEVDYAEINRRYQEMLASSQESQKAANAELAEIADWFVAEIRTSLPSDALVDFEVRYAQAAYPEVYPDHEDAAAAVEAARALPDLSADQMARLDAIAAGHAAGHAQVCHRMVEIAASIRQQPTWNSEDMTEFNEWQARNERMQVLQFDRSELNESTRRALRAILSEAQAERVHGLT